MTLSGGKDALSFFHTLRYVSLSSSFSQMIPFLINQKSSTKNVSLIL